MNQNSESLIKIQNEKPLVEFDMIHSSTLTGDKKTMKNTKGLNKDLLLEVDSDSCSQKSESEQIK